LIWAIGANTSVLSKFHPNLKLQEEILLNPKPRNFSEFSFEIHYESGEVPMDEVVPLFKTFSTIFYFNFFELGNVLFGSVKV
jgi:hypothetical protein